MCHTYRKLRQSPKAKFCFYCFDQLPWSIRTNKEIESAHVLKLSKLITSSAHYQNPPNMRFLRADRLYFNNDVFSCAMVHSVHLDDETLSKKGMFYYFSITYDYVKGFT